MYPYFQSNWYTYLKLNMTLCYLSGLSFVNPPWLKEKSFCFKTFWKIYHLLTDIIALVVTAGNLVGTIMLTEMFPILASVPPLVHGIQITGRILVFRKKRRFVEKYIKELDEILVENSKNPIEPGANFAKLHAQDLQYIRTYSIAETAFLLFSNCLFFLPEIFKTFFFPELSRVIMVSWYPYNATVSPNKEITNVVHTIFWMLVNFKIAACDSLVVALLVLHSIQFNHLKYLLEKLTGSEGTDLNYMKEIENIKFEAKMKWWIKQHQRTLRVSDKLKALYSSLIFFNYLECSVNMCLCAFLATEESPWSQSQRISAVFIVGTIFGQLFFTCRAGDTLRQSSDLVAKASFSFKIFKSSPSLRKNIFLVLQRGNLPVCISAFGLFRLTSEHYGILVKGVFSYYMALRQFKDRS